MVIVDSVKEITLLSTSFGKSVFFLLLFFFVVFFY